LTSAKLVTTIRGTVWPTKEPVSMKSERVTVESVPPSADSPRGRSTIEFPYMDQDDAFTVAASVFAVNGTSCEWEQLAAQLKQAATGGGFRMRVITARVFGLLTYERGIVTLTELGLRAVDPKFARAARAESFLAVPLFRAVFDKLNGASLPPMAAIERTMEQLGVAPKQKTKARQVFIRSAKQAGFFQLDSDRLTMPPNVSIAAPIGDTSKTNTHKDRETRRFGGGDDGGNNDIPPAILGLLEGLPRAGTPMSKKKRDALIAAFTATVGYIYPDADET
jgi:hypothetical protein